MPDQKFFLILCLARTGSTALMKALNVHPNITCANEPFNPQSRIGRRSPPVKDEAALAWRIAQLRHQYNGIKHVWDIDGWPFPSMALNAGIASMPKQRVVMLLRRNQLRRIVSVQLSEQTGVWQPSGNEDDECRLTFKYMPLDAKRILERLQTESEHIQALISNISSRVDLLKVWYEDVLSVQKHCRDEVRAHLTAILQFIDHETSDSRIIEAMVNSVEAGWERLRSQRIYDQIPRIHAIDELLGSDDTGWLFR